MKKKGKLPTKEEYEKDSENKKHKKEKSKPTIPKTNTERIAIGIPNFDKLIQGGFKKDSINLIVGSSGSGKSILATQFLVEGVSKGENCLYITFEEKKSVFFSNMKELGWNLEKLEKEGKFTFVEYTPEKVKTMLEEGGGIIENIVLEKKVSRIVIDSITSFELLFEKDIKKRAAALELFNLLRKWTCTSLLTYQSNPLDEYSPSSKTLEFESDSIIILYFRRGEKTRERFIEVLKMRGTDHSKEIYPLNIGKKIEIATKPFEGKL